MKKIIFLIFITLGIFKAHANFLDICGGILWHSDTEFVIDCINAAKESKLWGCSTLYDINKKLAKDDGGGLFFDKFRGWTLLMMAAYTGNEEIAKAILEAGADCLIKNYQNQTAINIARLKNHEHIVQLISQYNQPKALVDLAAKAATSKKGLLAILKSNLSGFQPKTDSISILLPQDILEVLKSKTPIDLHQKLEKNLGIKIAKIKAFGNKIKIKP